MPGTLKSYKENTFMITKKIFVYCYMLSIIPLRKTFFLMKVFFIQGAFKNIQGLLWKIQGLFKDIAQFFNFQGLFKDTMLFQGLFKTRVNHAKRP